MELHLTQQTFKAYAKNQHNSLKMRGVSAKLSDIQESLAIAFGYQNLATLYAAFNSDVSLEAGLASQYLVQKENLFVITWVFDEESGFDDVMAVYPPGTSIDDVATCDYEKGMALNEKRKIIPEGMVFSQETVALENFAIVPTIDKYGLSDSQHSSSAPGWVKEHLGFRVPKSGIEINLYDSGDDSSGRDNFLIWLNDHDAKCVREMFGM